VRVSEVLIIGSREGGENIDANCGGYVFGGIFDN